MRFDLLAVLGSACFSSVSAAAAGCAANNCYRQVAGNSFPTRPVDQDCSSYLASTVTPSQVTYTVIVTATQTLDVTATSTTAATLLTTETDTVTATALSTETDTVTTLTTNFVPVFQRAPTAAASQIPAYASACTKESQYSSACSCRGISPYTITAATPSTTVTVTVSPTLETSTHITSTTTSTTQTLTSFTTSTTSLVNTVTVVTTSIATSTFSCSGAVATIQLQAVGGTFAGQYLKVVDDPNDASDVSSFVASEASASHFVIDSSCHMSSTSADGSSIFFAHQNQVAVSLIWFNSADILNSYPQYFTYLQCMVAPVTNLLSCRTASTGRTSTLLQVQTGNGYDHGWVYLGNSIAYEPLTLQAFYV